MNIDAEQLLEKNKDILFNLYDCSAKDYYIINKLKIQSTKKDTRINYHKQTIYLNTNDKDIIDNPDYSLLHEVGHCIEFSNREEYIEQFPLLKFIEIGKVFMFNSDTAQHIDDLNNIFYETYADTFSILALKNSQPELLQTVIYNRINTHQDINFVQDNGYLTYFGLEELPQNTNITALNEIKEIAAHTAYNSLSKLFFVLLKSEPEFKKSVSQFIEMAEYLGDDYKEFTKINNDKNFVQHHIEESVNKKWLKEFCNYFKTNKNGVNFVSKESKKTKEKVEEFFQSLHFNLNTQHKPTIARQSIS